MKKNKKFFLTAIIMSLFSSGMVHAEDAKITFICLNNQSVPKIQFDYNYLTWHWHNNLYIKGNSPNQDLIVSLSKASEASFSMCQFDECKNPDITLRYSKGYNSYSGYVRLKDTNDVIYFSGDFDENHPDPCAKPSNP